MSEPEQHSAAEKEGQDMPQSLDEKVIRSRQRSRSLVTGLVLGALAILFYAIAIAKMTGTAG
ncbi:MAG: hypothetical protein B7Z20_09790 [Sphingobium sp. 32-64-5]|nr:MAG: hypothetical protein B7Z20_09790 [Sphingobium sp. 32-64-5]